MKELKIEYLPLAALTPYEKNTRKHQDFDVGQIAESIRQFGFDDPIGIWGPKNVIVEGHGRLLAAKKLRMKEVPCIRLDHLTDQQRREYAIAHNKTAELSEWDFDMLQLELEDLDMSAFDFDFEFSAEVNEIKEEETEEKGSLINKFIAPPFSVLDTRQGYWQDRKRKWLSKTGNLSETRDGEFGRLGGSKNESIMDSINSGTSNFDPVLAEIAYRWFCTENGKILDPFGGEQTKGVVAGELGYGYTAVEFRKEQVDLNSKICKKYHNVKYHCGDSNNISKIIKDRNFNMLFTSPPYYDLEVYSKEDMSALGTYDKFMEEYENIFSQCFDMLAENSFLVIKIGEIRDKVTGQYRCFVADNIKMFERIGFKFYDDIVLVNSCGTAPVRANKSMKNRKIVKVHQNVLVFYKGNLKNIANFFPELNFEGCENFNG